MILDEALVWYLLALCMVVPILALLIVAGVIAFVKRFKMMKKNKKNKKDDQSIDYDVNDNSDFVNVFGSDNIMDVKMELTRLTVTVKDIDKVDANKLQEYGASGVLLVGNQVKCSFKENILVYYNALKGNAENE